MSKGLQGIFFQVALPKGKDGAHREYQPENSISRTETV
jgi:hypothetical protein